MVTLGNCSKYNLGCRLCPDCGGIAYADFYHPASRKLPIAWPFFCSDCGHTFTSPIITRGELRHLRHIFSQGKHR